MKSILKKKERKKENHSVENDCVPPPTAKIHMQKS